ncbi:DUF3617 domain-containing protein [Sphingosinicella terrae]|jgi:hypothetical protein|uniref:DUF3617 domain-containing protein n=1 Tax=Sphingosinicella terrae TaxID=2172047 RepID=UPI0013B3AAA2|nr:DUF3617 domain-containing protein [Sphingosinicella terrae]
MRAFFVPMTALALVACGGTGGAGSAGGGTFEAGQWEMTTEMIRVNAPNLPQGTQMPLPPPQTVRHCMTEQEASRPGADLLSGGQSGCSSTNMQFADGRISGTVQCSQQGANMEMTLSGEFTPTTMQMNQQIRTQQAGMSIEMEARTTGRRIGDCPSTT